MTHDLSVYLGFLLLGLVMAMIGVYTVFRQGSLVGIIGILIGCPFAVPFAGLAAKELGYWPIVGVVASVIFLAAPAYYWYRKHQPFLQ